LAGVSSPDSLSSQRTTGWPVLDERALHGVVGEFVQEADPYTAADRVAVLMSLLAGAGCAINSGP
jgi:hypothetical protein